MITLTDFTAINDEIKSAINSTLDEIKNSSQMNYILYLANGDYRNEYDNPNSTLNPNFIDYQGDLHRDKTRLNFLKNFIKTFYSFPKVKLNCWGKLLSIFNSSLRKNISEDRRVDDDELRISLELMVYSHTWESDNFLKDLYRLAKLVDIGIYEWNVVVPPMGKHNFIRNEIKTAFSNKNNPLADIIKKGFHTSIRNAFAHSQYNLNNNSKTIWLNNYGGQDWELRNISFDDWSKRFVYSTLLSYYLLNIKSERKSNITTELGTNLFPIILPPYNRTVNIIYDTKRRQFNFE